jgi:hypothetical protein
MPEMDFFKGKAPVGQGHRIKKEKGTHQEKSGIPDDIGIKGENLVYRAAEDIEDIDQYIKRVSQAKGGEYFITQPVPFFVGEEKKRE